MLSNHNPAEGFSVKQILSPSATTIPACPLRCAMDCQWVIRDNKSHICFHVGKQKAETGPCDHARKVRGKLTIYLALKQKILEKKPIVFPGDNPLLTPLGNSHMNVSRSTPVGYLKIR